MTKSMMLTGVVIGSLFASANQCHALGALITYTFQADPSQPTQFNGSTITLTSLDGVFSFDIIDPNAAGGQVTSGLVPLSLNIGPVLPAAWAGTFEIDYTTVAGASATITVTGALDGTGTIVDATANGVWTVPDQASTVLLLGLTTGVLGAVRWVGKRLGLMSGNLLPVLAKAPQGFVRAEE